MSAWLSRARADRPSTNLLIHVRNKLRALKRLDARRTDIAARLILLREKPLPRRAADDLQRDCERTTAQYEQTVSEATARETELKLALNKRSPPHEEPLTALRSRLAALEARVLSEHALLSDGKRTSSALEALQSLREEHAALKSAADEALARRQDEYERGSVQDINVRSSLEDIVAKVADTRTILDTKIDKLQKGMF